MSHGNDTIARLARAHAERAIEYLAGAWGATECAASSDESGSEAIDAQA